MNEIKIDGRLYKQARGFCDKRDIRFKDFVETAIEEAMCRTVNLSKPNSVEIRKDKIDYLNGRRLCDCYHGPKTGDGVPYLDRNKNKDIYEGLHEKRLVGRCLACGGLFVDKW